MDLKKKGRNSYNNQPSSNPSPAKGKKPRYVEKRPTTVSLPEDCYVIDSWSAIEEFFRFKPRAVVKILVKSKSKVRMAQLMEYYGIDTKLLRVEADADDELIENVNVLVKLKPDSELELFSRMEKRTKDLIIAIDHISDPRNFGAITRSGAFFGVKDVVIPSDRQVTLTESSVKTSQGGFALVDLTMVTNLPRFVEKAKECGYWVIGADMEGEPLRALRGVYDKVILVVGSEESGISCLVKKKCDRMVAIPPVGNTIESLNVSVALGICLYELSSL